MAHMKKPMFVFAYGVEPNEGWEEIREWTMEEAVAHFGQLHPDATPTLVRYQTTPRERFDMNLRQSCEMHGC